MDTNLLLTNETFNQIWFQCTFDNDGTGYLLIYETHKY
jgi:hypothetical protein